MRRVRVLYSYLSHQCLYDLCTDIHFNFFCIEFEKNTVLNNFGSKFRASIQCQSTIGPLKNMFYGELYAGLEPREKRAPRLLMVFILS